MEISEYMFPMTVLKILRKSCSINMATNFAPAALIASLADYYAWCDQDDIWHPEKLARAVTRLSSVPEGVPALYCARTELVDQDGKHLGFSPVYSRSACFRNALVQNIAGGNTMVFNDALMKLLREAGNNATIVSHDWQFAEARRASVFFRLLKLKQSGVYRQTFIGNAGLFLAALLGRDVISFPAREQVVLVIADQNVIVGSSLCPLNPDQLIVTAAAAGFPLGKVHPDAFSCAGLEVWMPVVDHVGQTPGFDSIIIFAGVGHSEEVRFRQAMQRCQVGLEAGLQFRFTIVDGIAFDNAVLVEVGEGDADPFANIPGTAAPDFLDYVIPDLYIRSVGFDIDAVGIGDERGAANVGNLVVCNNRVVPFYANASEGASADPHLFDSVSATVQIARRLQAVDQSGNIDTVSEAVDRAISDGDVVISKRVDAQCLHFVIGRASDAVSREIDLDVVTQDLNRIPSCAEGFAEFHRGGPALFCQHDVFEVGYRWKDLSQLGNVLYEEIRGNRCQLW
ncbi:hypothetical protein WR25_25680 [Diploscapter pachys]|uniref:Glycosyltransferase 2-like domain-containing protein n=1 Tax=Diploscapter pachys TaxID=2018661 RepID=A0A2A2K698_9BILA|nr:hypothetical protein WR25_25680 [Diploscapter pachys]